MSDTAFQAKVGVSRRSIVGLNAVNFFLAEVVGVIIPFLNSFLKEHHWRYDQIGIATATAGFGTLLFQFLAGVISDRVSNRRLLLAVTSITLGVSYGILPFFAEHAFWVDLISRETRTTLQLIEKKSLMDFASF